MTPFSHLPGDILTGKDHARIFARECCSGAVSVLVAVNQRPGLPQVTYRLTIREIRDYAQETIQWP